MSLVYVDSDVRTGWLVDDPGDFSSPTNFADDLAIADHVILERRPQGLMRACPGTIRLIEESQAQGAHHNRGAILLVVICNGTMDVIVVVVFIGKSSRIRVLIRIGRIRR
jgi:hypothetical protein